MLLVLFIILVRKQEYEGLTMNELYDVLLYHFFLSHDVIIINIRLKASYKLTVNPSLSND